LHTGKPDSGVRHENSYQVQSLLYLMVTRFNSQGDERSGQNREKLKPCSQKLIFRGKGKGNNLFQRATLGKK